MNESKLLAEMVDNPNDPTPRLVMADWLEERGDPRAELMRIQEQLRSIDVPGRQELEARMQQLLRVGVQPVVPRWINSLGMPFVFIFPGEYVKGSPLDEQERGEDERQVRVRISQGFWLGETAVTQAQWKGVMNTQPWNGDEYVFEHSNCPATFVSWEDATELCRRLSEQQSEAGEKYSLPTEAQWEFACRTGTSSAYSFGNDANELPRYGWFDGNAYEAGENYAHVVGQKLPNPWGVFDMHGNVCEWCQDAYRVGGPDRVLKGGCWYYSAGYCRSAHRFRTFPESRNFFQGSRVVQIPSSSAKQKPASGAESGSH